MLRVFFFKVRSLEKFLFYFKFVIYFFCSVYLMSL